MPYFKKKFFFIFLSFIIFSTNFIFCIEKQKDTINEIDDTVRVRALNNSAFKFRHRHSEKALEYAEKALKLSKEIDFEKGKMIAYKNIAHIYKHQSLFQQAENYYSNSLKIAKELEDEQEIADSYTNIGKTLSGKKEYVKSLEYYLKSLEINKKIKNKKGISKSYWNIGILHKKQKNYNSSLEYYEKALKISYEIKDTSDMIVIYANIGNIHLYTKNYEKSLKTCKKALEIIKNKKKYIKFSALILNNIGELYREKKDYEKSIKYYHKSIKEKEKIDYQKGISISYNNIGEVYLIQKLNNEAIEFFEKSLKIAEKLNLVEVKHSIFESMSEASSNKKNYKSAYEYYLKFKNLDDELNQKESYKKITQMEVSYKYEQKRKVQEKEYSLLRNFTISFSVALLFMIVISIFLFFNIKEKKKANRILEIQKKEIIYKNQELEQKTEEILSQKDEITEQTNLLLKQNKEITDSIHYASRIQTAILSPQNLINSLLSENFILYLPKDIVSGDFYWVTQKNNKIIIVVADCTGHGVPGAFMSMLGLSSLNEIVNKIFELNSDEILNELRNKIKNSLHQTGKRNEASDGMDLALCIIDFENHEMQYSGANNPIYLIRDGKLNHYKADKMPIGIYPKEKPFSKKSIRLEKNDKVYLFSDGYPDQFGGTKGRKFLTRRLKKLLLKIHKEKMSEQKDFLEKTFFKWKGKEIQIDDILLMGIKI